jgi:hypothetical protein
LYSDRARHFWLTAKAGEAVDHDPAMDRTAWVAMTSAAVQFSTGNWRPARPWKRRALKKSKNRLSHRAWKSREVRGIPTFRLGGCERLTKPDISLATKSGHFNLLTTQAAMSKLQ